MRHATAPSLILDGILEDRLGDILRVVAHYPELWALELMNLSLDVTTPNNFQRVLNTMKRTSERRGGADREIHLRIRSAHTLSLSLSRTHNSPNAAII